MRIVTFLIQNDPFLTQAAFCISEYRVGLPNQERLTATSGTITLSGIGSRSWFRVRCVQYLLIFSPQANL